MNNYQFKRVHEADDFIDYLNEYERKFIKSLVGKDKDYELSDNQNSLLNKISQKVGRF